MEKNMYPHMPNEVPGVSYAPPSYGQAIAPPAEDISLAEGRSPMHPQQQPQEHPQEPPQIVYVQNAPLPPLGPQPCRVICHNCHLTDNSTVRYETSTKTHIIAALICVLGLFCCSCLPYCLDDCKIPTHYCKRCDAYLGSYNR